MEKTVKLKVLDALEGKFPNWSTAHGMPLTIDNFLNEMGFVLAGSPGDIVYLAWDDPTGSIYMEIDLIFGEIIGVYDIDKELAKERPHYTAQNRQVP